MYADQFGVDQRDALARLLLQGPAGELGFALEPHECDAFSGLWIEHDPEFGVAGVFTRDGEETISQYAQDGPLENLVEVRQAEATLKDLTKEDLTKAQSATKGIVSELGVQVASGISVFENRVVL